LFALLVTLPAVAETTTSTSPGMTTATITIRGSSRLDLNAFGVGDATSRITFTSIMVAQCKIVAMTILVTRNVVNPIFHQFTMQVSRE
jgi:hypothetical protein